MPKKTSKIIWNVHISHIIYTKSKLGFPSLIVMSCFCKAARILPFPIHMLFYSFCPTFNKMPTCPTCLFNNNSHLLSLSKESTWQIRFTLFCVLWLKTSKSKSRMENINLYSRMKIYCSTGHCVKMKCNAKYQKNYFSQLTSHFAIQ